jgi:hypothetical protein
VVTDKDGELSIDCAATDALRSKGSASASDEINS